MSRGRARSHLWPAPLISTRGDHRVRPWRAFEWAGPDPERAPFAQPPPGQAGRDHPRLSGRRRGDRLSSSCARPWRSPLGPPDLRPPQPALTRRSSPLLVRRAPEPRFPQGGSLPVPSYQAAIAAALPSAHRSGQLGLRGPRSSGRATDRAPRPGQAQRHHAGHERVTSERGTGSAALGEIPRRCHRGAAKPRRRVASSTGPGPP